MPISVDVFMNGGRVRGVLRGSSAPRDLLESGFPVELDGAVWRATDDATPATGEVMAIAPDDVVVLLAADDPYLPIHAAWHAVTLEAGPYRIEGELPTMPGFDPGRALTRPTGEFLLLRDLVISVPSHPAVDDVRADHGLVNRYAVERVAAEPMLAFYFPGAEIDEVASLPRG